MQNILPSEILGQAGIYHFLKEVQSAQQIKTGEIPKLLSHCGVQTPKIAYSQLMQINIILESEEACYLSPQGEKLWWLLNGLNGGDLKEMVHHLRNIEPTLLPYEIVTEGMTAEFIDRLATFPNFRRALICSPWVNLKPKLLKKFIYAVFKAQEISPTKKVDIIIMARPLRCQDPNYKTFLEVFRTLINIGADIVLREKLHAKLYIRDRGATTAGFSEAIFGSENLTTNKNLELGMRIINDNVIINKLITYYFDLYRDCIPFKEV